MSAENPNKSSSKSKGRPKKEDLGDKLVLRIDLEESLQNDFFKIKANQGLTNNTEVIRYCIREMASSKIYRVPEGLFTIIDDIVKDPRIQEKYIVTSVNDFIDRAIKQYILKTRADKSNLFDWEFRSNLDPKKLEVANSLLELQEHSNNSQYGVSFDELQMKTNNIAKHELNDILNNFIQRKLLKTMESNKKVYYFAIDRGFLSEEPL